MSGGDGGRQRGGTAPAEGGRGHDDAAPDEGELARGDAGQAAVITLFSAARLEHALNQFAMLRGRARAAEASSTADAVSSAGGADYVDHADHTGRSVAAAAVGTAPLIVGVWLDAAEAPSIEGVTIVRVPPTPLPALDAPGADPATADGSPVDGAAGAGAGAAGALAGAGARLRLAAGRNAGAAAAVAAGARLLVFLDADCLPGPKLLERYAEAAAGHPESVLCGPVTYLPEGARPRTARELAAATAPHEARPNLPAGETRAADEHEYRLFWSLSFACTAETWRKAGGFAELYEGYGAEDTDFASTIRERRIELRWVGGAHAYHQYHPTSSPPWQHLDDILRNGAIYHERWGSWPMEGWLVAFKQAGAVERVGEGWRRVLDAVSPRRAMPPADVPSSTGALPTP